MMVIPEIHRTHFLVNTFLLTKSCWRPYITSHCHIAQWITVSV